MREKSDHLLFAEALWVNSEIRSWYRLPYVMCKLSEIMYEYYFLLVFERTILNCKWLVYIFSIIANHFNAYVLRKYFYNVLFNLSTCQYNENYNV